MHSICNMPAHGSRGIWPRDVLKKVSRGLSRVEAGNPGFPRLVQVTSGGFSWGLFQCTKPSGVPRGPSHLQFPWLLRATMRSPLRSPAQVEGTQGFLPQPGKALERPSSTRLEARFPYHGSGAMTRSPSPLAWRPDFPGAPREAH